MHALAFDIELLHTTELQKLCNLGRHIGSIHRSPCLDLTWYPTGVVMHAHAYSFAFFTQQSCRSSAAVTSCLSDTIFMVGAVSWIVDQPISGQVCHCLISNQMLASPAGCWLVVKL